ncbi:MAG TPA: DNA repair protein RadC [Candidatus Limiplasma sp.]|nr:DNA repair protein RadC [Candidatus Limiplasma sp.]HRX08315.1 DNA repair protein RadC [Candidatus Limiplasma sp.]
MEHGGHRQRMRQRYAKQGLDGFAPHEVLELLLFYAIPQKNVNPLAHKLIDRFGSLYGVLNATPQQLRQVEGIGEYAATFLPLLQDAARLAMRTRSEDKARLASRQAAVDYCIRLLQGEKRELFYAICLDGQMQTLADVLIAKGSISDVPAYPRIVMDAVLTHNAHAVLLCHNHPSGSVMPSAQDLEATRMLSNLLSGIEVVLVDHLIVSEERAVSMVRNGYIRQSATGGGILVKTADAGMQVAAAQLKIDHRSDAEELL